MTIRSVIIIGFALILAALIHGGIYQMVIAGSGGGGEGITGDVRAYRLNRFTGHVDFCPRNVCAPVTWLPPEP